MTVGMGISISRDFITMDPGTGALRDADSPPTCVVYSGANDTPILSPTVTLRTALTGHYRVQLDVTEANGFEVGGSYNVVVSATVNGLSTKMVLTSFEVTIAIPRGAVVADGSNSATTFKTDLGETTDNFWKDALLVFLTGALAGQVKKITSYNGTTKFVSFTSGYTSAPGASDTFVLINA